jgi:hypothetical protein
MRCLVVPGSRSSSRVQGNGTTNGRDQRLTFPPDPSDPSAKRSAEPRSREASSSPTSAGESLSPEWPLLNPVTSRPLERMRLLPSRPANEALPIARGHPPKRRPASLARFFRNPSKTTPNPARPSQQLVLNPAPRRETCRRLRCQLPPATRAHWSSTLESSSSESRFPQRKEKSTPPTGYTERENVR